MENCNNVPLEAETNVNNNVRVLCGKQVPKDSLTLGSKKKDR